MLKYFIYKSSFKLCSILFILSQFLCHTVTGENDNIVLHSRLDVSSSNSPLSKREELKPVDVISQTPSPTVADHNSTSDSVNKTLPQLNPPVGNVQLNSTLSLPGWLIPIKSGALERTGFVVLGFMLIIVVVFIVRGIRLRHKKSKSRKYGIITSTDMEMEPLDNDEDDEEDTTLFDAQHKYSIP